MPSSTRVVSHCPSIPLVMVVACGKVMGNQPAEPSMIGSSESFNARTCSQYNCNCGTSTVPSMVTSPRSRLTDWGEWITTMGACALTLAPHNRHTSPSQNFFIILSSPSSNHHRHGFHCQLDGHILNKPIHVRNLFLPNLLDRWQCHISRRSISI